MAILANTRVVTPREILEPGWIRLADGRVDALGAGDPPRSADPIHDLAGGYVLPGFVDLHMRGGGGAQVTTADPEEIRRVIEFHRRHGTTRTLASLVTSPVDEMATAARVVPEVMRSGDALGASIAGIHLEGPFLNPRYRGAHHSDFVLARDVKALRHLLDAGAGAVRVVTLAPELDGGMDLVRAAAAAGVAASVGHTDATSAAGMRDGRFGLGPPTILAGDGKVTLLDGTTNAGSTLTMDRAVRHAGNCVGVPPHRRRQGRRRHPGAGPRPPGPDGQHRRRQRRRPRRPQRHPARAGRHRTRPPGLGDYDQPADGSPDAH